MDAAERFDRDGFMILEGVFDPSLIDALRTEYQRQYPDVQRASDAYVVGEGRIQVTMQLSGPFLSPELYANSSVLEFVRSVLGDDVVIDNFSLVSSLPRATDQHQHVDHPDLFPDHIFSRASIRPYAVNVAIPLVDLTPQTGTTKLFAGSHKTFASESKAELPYIERGSCYAVDYRLHHQGTQNQSNEERPIVYLVYARPWFTDIINYGNNVRIRIMPEDFATIPEIHRPLFRRLAAKGAFDRTVEELKTTGK